jgi:hypothetical protein
MTGIGSRTARAGVAVGGDADTASTAGAVAAEVLGGQGGVGVLNVLAQSMAASAIAQAKATDAMNKAAEAQAAAAKNRPAAQPAPSTIDAARIQAGLAAQGS